MNRLRYVLSALVVTGTFVGISAEQVRSVDFGSTVIQAQNWVKTQCPSDLER